MTEPMAPYLATATNGFFDLTVTTLPDGTPNYVAVDPTITSSRAVLDLIPAGRTASSARSPAASGLPFTATMTWTARPRPPCRGT